MVSEKADGPAASPPLPLPDGVASRRVEGVNGLSVRLLEAGPADGPAVLLLHGFPELAFSWRKILPGLAAAGYRVLAPDQRGYGGTTGWEDGYGADLGPFRQLRLAGDMVALLGALGVERLHGLVGHDFGSTVAAHLALARPDLVGRVALMSAPFAGPPPMGPPPPRRGDLAAELAALDPPRKLYQAYYSTPEAAADMAAPPGGLHAFLRAYFHMKSADWPENRPHPLADGRAETLAALPAYYVMPLGASMPEAVAAAAPSADEVAACRWLPDAELAVYAEAFARTGFQGGLNWYRCAVDGSVAADLRLFAGRRIEVPGTFISGAQDWGVRQTPGAFEAMTTRAFAEFRGAALIADAGHWVQLEQPAAALEALLAFMA